MIIHKGIIIKLKSNKNIKNITLIKSKIDVLLLKKLTSHLWLLFASLIGFVIMLGGIYTIISDGNMLLNSEPLQVAFVGFIFFIVCGWIFIASILAEIKSMKKYQNKLQKVNLEDVNFLKHYQAYSYDQVEARYLITTSFIERFLNFGKAFHTKRLKCSFINDGNIIIVLDSAKNEFEIGGLFTSLKNPKHIEKFANQIVSLLLIVDYFKLDEKTGL